MLQQAPGKPASARGAQTARTLARAVALAAMMTSVSSCSLVSLKTPEKPLSTRDLNARILTHEFSARFIVAIEQTADEMSAATEEPGLSAATTYRVRSEKPGLIGDTARGDADAGGIKLPLARW